MDESQSFRKIKLINNKSINISKNNVEIITSNFSSQLTLDEAKKIKIFIYEFEDLEFSENRTGYLVFNTSTYGYFIENFSIPRKTSAIWTISSVGLELNNSAFSYKYYFSNSNIDFINFDENTLTFNTHLYAASSAVTFKLNLYVIL